jgi:SAM-dependent methyltransferase
MTTCTEADAYSSKVSAELALYSDPESVPGLPPICYYWAERYCLPLIQEVGFPGLNELLDAHVAEQCARRSPEPARLVSLGSGAGETEIGIAERLAQRGIQNLEVTLLELNPQLIDLALADAKRRGLGEDQVRGAQIDLNAWHPDGVVDIYFANQSLHHLVELESVLTGVHASLDADGALLVNDMIGRNGHVRWPEAAEIVRRIWSIAPERYRFNHFRNCVDDEYWDIDCSQSHFEGVRAQDILPLLLERFHPEVYITFSNIADPFVDRIYGPNFDVNNPEDLAFIDAIGRLDDATLDLGFVTPTHLIGSFRTRPVSCRYPRGRSPQRTVRKPDRTDQAEHLPDATGGGPQGDAQATYVSDIADIPALVEEAQERYEHLRQRKAVRIALALAALRSRLISVLRR